MTGNTQRYALVLLSLIGLVLLGAGVGWVLAVLFEHISRESGWINLGQSIGHIGAIIGGIVGAIWAILSLAMAALELFDFATSFTRIFAIRIPPRPHWLPPDKREEV